MASFFFFFFFNSTITRIFLLLYLLSSDFGFLQGVAPLGINYGQVANNLPSPDQVLTLLKALKITKTRIYDTNPQVLDAFADSGIELIITVPNDEVAAVADPNQALQWVAANVMTYFPSANITGIAVGNEVFATDDPVLMSNLVPAMVSIQNALVQVDLGSYIHVSTANSLAMLKNSYPPSAGAFDDGLAGFMMPLLKFLAETKSPFWINAYPYFAYKDDPNGVPLDYVLFNPNAGMVDPYTKLRYDNMLYAQVDAVIFAVAGMGFGELDVRVSETGWPSKGDPDEVGATLENAAIYNTNLLQRQVMSEGTPLRPNQRLEVFIFALFNEDMKPGPTSERNYGLFQPDGTMAYNVGLTGASSHSASVSLTSSASQVTSKGFGSLGYWIFVFLLTFEALMRRPV